MDNKEYLKLIPIVDKEIKSLEDDVIGISNQVDILKQVINDGASVIAISSSYGGGKSSVCNILSKSEMFKKSSTISLWDVNNNQINHNNDNIENPLFSSFLYQLASDYGGITYAKYISKAMNKRTTFFNVYFKNKLFIFLFFILLLIMLLFCSSFLIINPLLKIEFELKNRQYIIYFTSDFIRNLSLIAGGVVLFFSVLKTKFIYTSWKNDKDRLITYDDITSLYISLINDSINDSLKCLFKKKKKNLIIIEDLDRCLDENMNKDYIMGFIKDIVKLRHHTCSNKKINKKLNSVVLIIAFDEKRLLKTQSQQSQLANKLDYENLNKLFDYRLDLGEIHNDDYIDILNTLVKKHITTNEALVKKFQIILRSQNNSIRLIKQTINDIIQKYTTLKSRFNDSKYNIKIESCIAYAYLKNNFYDKFNDLLSNEESFLKIMRDKLSSFHKKTLVIKEDVCEFKNELSVLIEKQYLDEEYKIYFYNYPKNSKVLTIEESTFRNYMLGLESINVDSNRQLSKDFVLKTHEYMCNLGRNYPDTLIYDKYTLKILLGIENNDLMKKFFLEVFKLDSEINVKKACEYILLLLGYGVDIDINRILPYFKYTYNIQWKNIQIVSKNYDIFNFRILLCKLLADEIVYFEQLYKGNNPSIIKEEFDYLKDKKNAKKLINENAFNEDLEFILDQLINDCDSSELIKYLAFWNNNIFCKEKFREFLLKSSELIEEYNSQYFMIVKQHYFEIIEDPRIQKFINKIISKSQKSVIEAINNLHLPVKLTNENMAKMLSFEIGLMVLISCLYYNNFDLLINSDFNFQSRFETLYSLNIQYLDYKVIDFKKALLLEEFNSKFDNLFVKKFERYNFEIDWMNVHNIHLLVMLNKDNSEIIIRNLKNIVMNENTLYLTIEDLKRLPSSFEARYKLSYYIIENYANCYSFNENIKSQMLALINLHSNEEKANLAIEYQIQTNTIMPEYNSLIYNYSNEFENLKYAEFINKMMTSPDINTINTIKTDYPFNDNIIKVMFDNKKYVKVINSSLLADSNTYLDDALSHINQVELINICDTPKKLFRLLDNDVFLNRLPSFINSFTLSSFIDYLNNVTNIKLISIILSTKNDNDILQLLKSLKSIENEKAYDFIKVVSNKKALLQSNEDCLKHIKGLLPKGYRGLLTRNTNK